MAFGDTGRNWSSGGGFFGGGARAISSNFTSSSPSGFQQGTGASFASTPQSRYRSIFDLTMSQYAPQLAYQQFQRDQNALIGQYQSGYYGNQRANAQTDANLALRGIALDEQGLGLQRADNAIDARGAQRDIGYYTKLLAMMPQYRGLSREDYDNTRARIGREGDMERLGIRSEYTQRGNFFTPMHRVNRDNSFQAQSQAETAARIGFDRDQLGLTEKELGLGRSRGSAEDQAAKIANRNAYLDLEGARLNLSREQVNANLKKGLDQLGYSQFIDGQQLADRAAQGDQLAQQILTEALTIAGALGSGQVGSNYMNYFGG